METETRGNRQCQRRQGNEQAYFMVESPGQRRYDGGRAGKARAPTRRRSGGVSGRVLRGLGDVAWWRHDRRQRETVLRRKQAGRQGSAGHETGAGQVADLAVVAAVLVQRSVVGHGFMAGCRALRGVLHRGGNMVRVACMCMQTDTESPAMVCTGSQSAANSSRKRTKRLFTAAQVTPAPRCQCKPAMRSCLTLPLPCGRKAGRELSAGSCGGTWAWRANSMLYEPPARRSAISGARHSR
jgi:hypothetical protein